MVDLLRVDLGRAFARPESRANPVPVYARLRELGPVLRSKDLLGEGFVLPRYEEVARALRDPRFASDRTNGRGGRSDQWWVPSLLKLLSSSMVLRDPPEHRRLRNLVQKAFTPAMVENLSGRVAGIAEELLDLAGRKPVVDLMADFALPLPLTVIAEILGVPPVDRLRFRTLLVRLQGTSEANALSFVRNYPHMLRLKGFLQDLVRLRRQQPGEDLVTALVQAEEEGDRLSEDELIAMVFLLLFAGHETTVNLIGTGLLALLENPEQLERLRAQPELMESAVEEMLRYGSPVETGTPRFTVEPVEFRGQVIPAGESVVASLLAADHDPEQFANPERFDITREPNRHIAFGFGIHFCLGAPLARLEGAIAINLLLERMPRLRLAVEPSKLRWRDGILVHGLQRLPVAF